VGWINYLKVSLKKTILFFTLFYFFIFTNIIICTTIKNKHSLIIIHFSKKKKFKNFFLLFQLKILSKRDAFTNSVFKQQINLKCFLKKFFLRNAFAFILILILKFNMQKKGKKIIKFNYNNIK